MKATKVTEQEVKDFNYISIQSGGYFYDACLRKGFVDEGDSCVIEFRQFMKFMNDNEVTAPLFKSPSYSVCIDVAKQMNESAFAAKNGVNNESE
jgi:hypothetical protein